MHNFFVDPGSIKEGRAELRGQIAHQIARVLRLQPGDLIDLLDNSGFAYSARIVAVSKNNVSAEVIGRRLRETEPPLELVLYQALLKGQKIEWILQKGTEIGVSRFVPVLCERSVSRPSPDEIRRKIGRWEEIVREAAEQSGRAVLPKVAGLLPFEDACREANEADLAVMLWEKETSLGLKALLRRFDLNNRESRKRQCPREIERRASAAARDLEIGTQNQADSAQQYAARATDLEKDAQALDDLVGRLRVSILVGPEGGFSEKEVGFARRVGVWPASLGPRVLRSETAALVAVSMVLYDKGDLGG